jgi:hypothetical protein
VVEWTIGPASAGDDIVGASQAHDGTKPDPHTLRMLIQEVAPFDLTDMNVRLIWRRDRYRRPGPWPAPTSRP